MEFKAKYLVPYKGINYYSDDAFENRDFNSKFYTGLIAYNFVIFTVPSFVITTITLKGLDSLL